MGKRNEYSYLYNKWWKGRAVLLEAFPGFVFKERVTSVFLTFVTFYSYTILYLEKYRPYFFFAKTRWISMKRACTRHVLVFSCLSIATVNSKQHLSKVVFSALIGKWWQRFGFWVISIYPGHARLHEVAPTSWIPYHWWQVLGVWIRPGNQIIPSFSLQWKPNESTKHYLTQMLLAINWCYWQVRKNSCMRMNIQGDRKSVV